MISKSNAKFTCGVFDFFWKIINCVPCDSEFVITFFKCYQPQPSALADNTYFDLDYSGCQKPHPITINFINTSYIRMYKYKT